MNINVDTSTVDCYIIAISTALLHVILTSDIPRKYLNGMFPYPYVVSALIIAAIILLLCKWINNGRSLSPAINE